MVWQSLSGVGVHCGFIDQFCPMCFCLACLTASASALTLTHPFSSAFSYPESPILDIPALPTDCHPAAILSSQSLLGRRRAGMLCGAVKWDGMGERGSGSGRRKQ